jgi:hypothetical protein
MGLNWGKDRNRELMRLAREQERDDERLRRDAKRFEQTITAIAKPRKYVSKAQARAQSPKSGMVTKHITCKCGHSGVARFELARSRTLYCRECGSITL